jgi:hypothetical protein
VRVTFWVQRRCVCHEIRSHWKPRLLHVSRPKAVMGSVQPLFQSPLFAGTGRSLDPTRRQLDKEQHEQSLQPSPGPHLYSERSASTISSQCRLKKFLADRLPAPLGRGLNSVLLQNVGSRAVGYLMPQVGKSTLDPAIAQSPFSAPCAPPSRKSATFRGRPGPRCTLASYLLAISFRRQANKVSGATILATGIAGRAVLSPISDVDTIHQASAGKKPWH